MPKKATAVTVAAKNPGLSLVNLSGDLNVNDILSVVTSRAETRFHQELAKAKTALDEANKNRKAIEEKLCTAYRAAYNAAAQTVVAALKASVEALGGKVRVNKPDEHTVKNLARDNDGKIVAIVQVVGNVDSNSYYDSKFRAAVEPTPEFLACEAELKTATEAVTAAQNTALHWRQKLAQVPILERRARAKIAETKLAESESGNALLDLLTNDLEAEFSTLPTVV